MVNVPEVGPHQGLATVPAPVLVDHHVVLARDKLVTIAVLDQLIFNRDNFHIHNGYSSSKVDIEKEQQFFSIFYARRTEC